MFESSTEFLECEKEKLFLIDKENADMLLNLKKFIDLLDRVEIETNRNINVQIHELQEAQIMSDNVLKVFQIICSNCSK